MKPFHELLFEQWTSQFQGKHDCCSRYFERADEIAQNESMVFGDLKIGSDPSQPVVMQLRIKKSLRVFNLDSANNFGRIQSQLTHLSYIRWYFQNWSIFSFQFFLGQEDKEIEGTKSSSTQLKSQSYRWSESWSPNSAPPFFNVEEKPADYSVVLHSFFRVASRSGEWSFLISTELGVTRKKIANGMPKTHVTSHLQAMALKKLVAVVRGVVP